MLAAHKKLFCIFHKNDWYPNLSLAWKEWKIWIIFYIWLLISLKVTFHRDITRLCTTHLMKIPSIQFEVWFFKASVLCVNILQKLYPDKYNFYDILLKSSVYYSSWSDVRKSPLNDLHNSSLLIRTEQIWILKTSLYD